MGSMSGASMTDTEVSLRLALSTLLDLAQERLEYLGQDPSPCAEDADEAEALSEAIDAATLAMLSRS